MLPQALRCNPLAATRPPSTLGVAGGPTTQPCAATEQRASPPNNDKAVVMVLGNAPERKQVPAWESQGIKCTELEHRCELQTNSRANACTAAQGALSHRHSGLWDCDLRKEMMRYITAVVCAFMPERCNLSFPEKRLRLVSEFGIFLSAYYGT